MPKCHKGPDAHVAQGALDSQKSVHFVCFVTAFVTAGKDGERGLRARDRRPRRRMGRLPVFVIVTNEEKECTFFTRTAPAMRNRRCNYSEIR